MDYEKAYTNAVARAKQAIKDCGDNEGRKRMIEEIFPELAESDEKIRKEIIKHLRLEIETELTLSEDEGKRWIDWLEKQGKRSDNVEQLTAFAQHLNKRGAFRDDLCMDFEHEAQSFIEIQNNKEL